MSQRTPIANDSRPPGGRDKVTEDRGHGRRGLGGTVVRSLAVALVLGALVFAVIPEQVQPALDELGDEVLDVVDPDDVVPADNDPAPADDTVADPLAEVASSGELIVDMSFDEAPTGPLSVDTVLSAFQAHGAIVPNPAEDRLEQLAIAPDPVGESGASLEVRIPARELSGMNFNVYLDEGPGYREAALDYRVQFGAGFDFDPNGGKLPGLAGAPSDVRGQRMIPSGCTAVTGDNGFSARGKWISRLPETNQQPAFAQYVYHPGKEHRCGDTVVYDDTPTGAATVLESGRWYRVQHHIVMNDPGEANGTIEAWVDGEPALRMEGLAFRNDDTWGVNTVYMAAFFGGNGYRFKHDREETMYFDDVKVYGIEPIQSSSDS